MDKKKIIAQQYLSNLPIIVAFDFDGTITLKDEYPNIGTPNIDIINIIKSLQENNVKVILWSCREGVELNGAVTFCMAYGIKFDAINENLPVIQEYCGKDTRKIYADLYIDDKAIPHIMSPRFWAHRLGLEFNLKEGIHHAD